MSICSTCHIPRHQLMSLTSDLSEQELVMVRATPTPSRFHQLSGAATADPLLLLLHRSRPLLHGTHVRSVLPENAQARDGDMVRIVTLEFEDAQPAEDILCGT